VQNAYRGPRLIRKTAAKYRVQAVHIHKWRKQLPDLLGKAKDNPRARIVHKGRIEENAELEKLVYDLIMEQCAGDISVRS
jgi:hypothetical protein